MGYVYSEKEPQLVGIFNDVEIDEVFKIERMVEKLNKDLVDSGFERYQYSVVRRGSKTYIEPEGA